MSLKYNGGLKFNRGLNGGLNGGLSFPKNESPLGKKDNQERNNTTQGVYALHEDFFEPQPFQNNTPPNEFLEKLYKRFHLASCGSPSS
jgi:hypothetical protein